MPKVHGAVESERTALLSGQAYLVLVVAYSREPANPGTCAAGRAANRLSQVMGARLGMITLVEWQWFACKDLLPI